MAVLEKRARVNLSTSDAYVNIAGGLKMNEPAIDLGIALAVVSSYKDQVIDEKTVVFGEVGLGGEVRAVSMEEQRVLEAKKLGFERVILPAVCMKSVEKIGGIALVPVENIQDVWGKTDNADQVLHFRWRSSTTGAPAVIRNRDGALNSYKECKK